MNNSVALSKLATTSMSLTPKSGASPRTPSPVPTLSISLKESNLDARRSLLPRLSRSTLSIKFLDCVHTRSSCPSNVFPQIQYISIKQKFCILSIHQNYRCVSVYARCIVTAKCIFS